MGAIERTRSVLKNANVDAIMLVNPPGSSFRDPNMTYITGIPETPERAIMFATPDKVTMLVTPLEHGDLTQYGPKDIEYVCTTGREDTNKEIMERTRGVVGINGGFIPWYLSDWVNKTIAPKAVVDVREAFAAARAIKSEDEIAKIRKAVGITKQALHKLLTTYLRPGITEIELAARFEFLIGHAGASERAFRTNVSFGANSASPHHKPGFARLHRNTIVLVDCGAKWEGYCGDITATMLYKPDEGGIVQERFKQMHSTVQEAQARALSLMRPGVEMQVPHNAALSHIEGENKGIYKGKFITNLGHSVGIVVHDDPYLSFYAGNTRKLEAGMVMSNEPGIYVKDFGGVRLEEVVVITQNGAEVL